MTPDTALETKTIKQFVVAAKRDRYLAFVASTRNRRKLIANLSSATSFLRMEAFTAVSGSEEKVIRQALQAHGLAEDTCYIISDNAHLDGFRLPLSEALRAVIGWGASTLLIFGNAQLVYYEGEGKNVRYLSQ